MVGYNHTFLKTRIFALVLVFTFLLSGLGYGSIPVLAQQPP